MLEVLLALQLVVGGEVIDQQISQITFDSFEQCGQFVIDINANSPDSGEVTWFEDFSFYVETAPNEWVVGQCIADPNNTGI